MNEQNYPRFEQMHVLRTEALISLRDRAYDLLPYYLEDFSDGIVNGCRIEVSKDVLTVGRGVVKYNGFWYLIKKPMSIEYQPTEEYAVLRFKFLMPEEGETTTRYQVGMTLTPELESAPDEIELGRFKLKAGAILRTKYVDFNDRMTEFNTLHEIYRPQAARGDSTIPAEITMAFAKEAMAYELENPLDIAFCQEALRGAPICRDQLKFYLYRRLKLEESEEWNPLQVYNWLVEALGLIEQGGDRDVSRVRRKRREVLVD